MGLHKLSSVELRVTDLEEAAAFHRDILGLTEIASCSNRIYLGCGPTERFTLALVGGGTGVNRFAFEAQSDDYIERIIKVLNKAGVSNEIIVEPDPGVARALRFKLPEGHVMDIVTLNERVSYSNPSQFSGYGSRIGAPLDIDHITLRVGKDIKPTMNFLRDLLGFASSDILELANGEPMATWMHASDRHHDVAMFIGAAGETLDHLAWKMAGMDHIKLTLDCLARAGLLIEAGPGRHGVGGNLYAYFQAPGGNRYELTAEMPRANRKMPALVWNDPEKTFSAWGALPAVSLRKGS